MRLVKLAVVVTLDELDKLARSFVPLTVDLSTPELGKRIIRVHRVSRVELVPNEGIRILGGAEVDWTVLGLTLPVKVDELAVRVHISLDGGSLKSRLEIECADLRHVPELVENVLETKINDALKEESAIPSLAFDELANRTVPLPGYLTPLRDLVLASGGGYVSIEPDTLTFMVDVGIRACPSPAPA